MTVELPRQLDTRLAASRGLVLFLTGAGVSAESGIPTFRGPEGHWTVGSRNYHPQELATRRAFQRLPMEVWSWYLYRRGVALGAEPNAAHLALARLESALGDDFLLATQNVDGLHLRAGNSPGRTYQIHGNISFMRCWNECSDRVFPIPEGLDRRWRKHRLVTDRELALLHCPVCDRLARPHVLWFDESYNETHYRWHSTIAAAEQATLLIVVGTSGSTTLPITVGQIAARRGLPMLVLNPEPNPFSESIEQTGSGWFLQGTAGELVPAVVDSLLRGRAA